MISLILCSYNGESRIYKTLEALSKILIPLNQSIELVFVDSNSTISMLDFVEKSWRELGNPFNLKTFYQVKQGKVAALQKGIEISKGNYFVIVDDDNELDSSYLIEGFRYVEKKNQVGVLGGQGVLPKDLEVPIWFESYAYHFACGSQAKNDGNVQPFRNVVYGAGMWVRRAAYDKAINNGFRFIFDFHGSNQKVSEKNNGGEDGELCWAIRFQGYEIHYLSSLRFIHRISTSKLSDSYFRLITERTSKSTLLGSLYYRIYRMNIDKVHNFWLKDLGFIFINYFKNFQFNTHYLTLELKRNLSNVFLLLKMRAKYDQLVNRLLTFKKSSI
jgi:glycosyltransferase involved in cell wall biosynthesis